VKPAARLTVRGRLALLLAALLVLTGVVLAATYLLVDVHVAGVWLFWSEHGQAARSRPGW
jgi:hypothetical protein